MQKQKQEINVSLGIAKAIILLAELSFVYLVIAPGLYPRTELIKTVYADEPRPEEVIYDKTWALDQWEAVGGKELRDKVNIVMQNESNWKPKWYCNAIGSMASVDMGYYQFNSIHFPKRLDPECAFNLKCSTGKAIELWKEQGFTPWVYANKLNIK